MKLHFYKLHGLGNDCVVSYDYPACLVEQALNFIPKLANRYCGIGFDQLLLIKLVDNKIYCQIFNADGSIAEQCGNGMRCAARVIHEQKLLLQQPKMFVIHNITTAAPTAVLIKDYGNITVNLGVIGEIQVKVLLDLADYGDITGTYVALGNPHFIYNATQDLADLPLEQWALRIVKHSYFPNGVNIGFMQILSPDCLKLITYERGVGFTLACGSNACAAVIAGIFQAKLADTVTVLCNQGQLQVQYHAAERRVALTGAASLVFTGLVDLRDFA